MDATIPRDLIPRALASEWATQNPELVRKVQKALLCGPHEAHVGIEEAVKFLALVADKPSTMLTPSHRVDLVWHEMILFTRAYASFCDRYFGRFIHHQPGGGHEENQKQFAVTLERYRSMYGQPPSDFWNSSLASCGPCESG